MELSDEEIVAGVAEWGRAFNRIGHASYFDEKRGSRELVELEIAKQFAKSLRHVWEISLFQIENRPTPEPDCRAEGPSGPLTIEIKRLSDQTLRERIARAKKGGKPLSDHEIFERSQWPIERLDTFVNKLIDENVDNPYPADVDILLLCTDEPWLTPTAILQLVTERRIHPRQRFRSAFLMMSHVPGLEYYPLFQLYGPHPSTW